MPDGAQERPSPGIAGRKREDWRHKPEGAASSFRRMGLGATLLAMGGQAYAMFRSLVPNVLYEDPQRFKVGTLDQFGEGREVYRRQARFHFSREKHASLYLGAVHASGLHGKDAAPEPAKES